jgi:ribonuclease BN (tRNA processing enzyme)
VNLLVDGGSGTLGRLHAAGVDARLLDGGIYSHRHLDHTGDLGPLLFALRVGIDVKRRRDYPIWAGAGFRGFLGELRTVYGEWLQTSEFGVPVAELPLDGPGTAALPGGLRLDTLPANHGAGALHLRFTSPGGASVVFSGDTGPSENLARLAAGVDLLVTECAVPEPDPWGAHLCPADVLRVIDDARPARTLVTHFYPDMDEAETLARLRSSGRQVDRAYDGQRCVVPA